MADIKIIGENGQEVVPDNSPIVSEHSIDAPVVPELEMKAIAQVLGLENDLDLGKYEEKLGTLLDYAKTQTDDHSLDSLKWVVRELGFKLGTPKIGEKMVNYLAEYAYLSMEGKKIEKEKAQFEK